MTVEAQDRPIALSDSIPAWRWSESGIEKVSECVAEEIPIAFQYNGMAHVVMLASPGDLEDFALGFSLSEGIVHAADEVLGVKVEVTPLGIRLAIDILLERAIELGLRRRNMTGRTGCGLCGTESLDQVFRPMLPVEEGTTLSASRLHAALAELAGGQSLQRRTGGVHAAFWLGADGRQTLLREDIGRHNAFDKLIGGIATRGWSFAEGAAFITSRASSEMIQKAIAVGIPILVAVSAPTLQAIRLAERHGLTLVAFARPDHHVVYAHKHRIVESPP